MTERARLAAPYARPAAWRSAALLLAALALASFPSRAAAERVRRRQKGAASEAESSGAPLQHGPGVGAVVYVTHGRAYLDAGSGEGLAPGQTLRFTRAGQVVASCKVEAVAARHATCRAAGARRGDLFALGPRPAAQVSAALPPLLSPEETERRAALVAAAPVEKVEHKASSRADEPAVERRVEVVLAHGTWAASGSTPWQRESADVSIRGAEVGAGLQLYADLRALHWTARPDNARYRPDDWNQLLVWEAQLAARDPGRPLALALGRVQPWGIPGATVFDGMQVGWQRAGGPEIGFFGGGMPDLQTLTPTFQRSTAGAYGSFDLGSGVYAARQDARFAVVTSPELGTRVEGELRSLVLLGRSVSVSGDLRFGMGGDRQAPAAVDGAQIDLAGRPLPQLQISGAFRYWGLFVPDAVAPAFFPGPERRGDLTAGWDFGGLLVSATGGFARDITYELDRRFIGPGLALPRLFGGRGGLSAGYLEEWGWISGRSAYLQAALQPGPRLRFIGRVSYAADTRDVGSPDESIGLFASLDADLTRWLSLRASVLARFGLATPRYDSSTGVNAIVGLAAGY